MEQRTQGIASKIMKSRELEDYHAFVTVFRVTWDKDANVPVERYRCATCKHIAYVVDDVTGNMLYECMITRDRFESVDEHWCDSAMYEHHESKETEE